VQISNERERERERERSDFVSRELSVMHTYCNTEVTAERIVKAEASFDVRVKKGNADGPPASEDRRARSARE